MQINPETLKKLRKTKGFSQQTLADTSGVAKKTIARIETGKGEPRGATVQELAKALRVKPEVLAEEPESEEVRDEELRKHGLEMVSLPFDGKTIHAYDLVSDRYGVDMKWLINAAPMLFTLLAEMSLADRRRRIEEADTAMAAFEQVIPEHLPSIVWATYQGFPYEDETKSIAVRDLFGRHIEEYTDDPIDYYRYRRNPFSNFLEQLSKGLGPDNDAIDHEDIWTFAPDLLPYVSLFKTFLKSLTGGSSRADFALSRGYVRLGQIPKHLRGEDEENEHVVSERVEWLEAQVPDDDWAEHERFMASKKISSSIVNEPPSEGGAENA